MNKKEVEKIYKEFIKKLFLLKEEQFSAISHYKEILDKKELKIISDKK